MMLWTLIKKEVLETMLDLRFWVVSVLFLLLIPLSLLVSREDYEQRLADYQQSHQMYRDNYKQVSSNMEAQGFRPPAPQSVFASGITSNLPDIVITSQSGLVRAIKNPAVDNVQGILLGKVDLQFIATYVISLAALMLTYNCVSGERGNGTLRLMIANSLPRGHIIGIKVASAYMTLWIPLTLALTVGILVLQASSSISLVPGPLLNAFGCILLCMALFTLCMILIGTCISTMTVSATTSMVVALLVWVILVIGIPKTSPMIAQIIYPIESQNVVQMRTQLAAKALDDELNQKEIELYLKCREGHGITDKNNFDQSREEAAMAEYDEQIPPIRLEYEQRKTQQIRRINQDYENKRTSQTAIATNLSRLSPVSCFTYLATGLANTGAGEVKRFWQNAERFQHQVKQEIYDKIKVKTYSIGCGSMSQVEYAEGFDRETAVLPDIDYHYGTLAEILQEGFWDVTLLSVFPTALFALAFISFLKYDVR